MAIVKMYVYSPMFLFHLNCLGRRNCGVKVAEQDQLCPWSFLVAQFTCLALHLQQRQPQGDVFTKQVHLCLC